MDVLSEELTAKVAAHVADNLATYVRRPHQINQLNAEAIRLGQLNPSRLDQLETHFWQQIQYFPSTQYLYFGAADGSFRGAERLGANQLALNVVDRSQPEQLVRYLASSNGGRTSILDEQSGYEPRQRPWYRAAIQSDTPTWSEIYPDFNSQRLGITAVQAIHSTDGRLLGVLGVDLFSRAWRDSSAIFRSAAVVRPILSSAMVCSSPALTRV
ncbi:MAG: hypothetical protein HC838_14785 [Spirulinaceae cyanobacterium RM2_2_10]|nr:hypothetical protein [Spirulinaceae cyanobacterium RM2_2_10]